MKKTVLISLLILIFSLAACTQDSTKTNSASTGSSSTSETPVIDHNGETRLQDQIDYLEGYTEGFPVYEFSGDVDITFTDRHFELQDPPENIAEELVANTYYYNISCQFDELYNIYVDNDYMKILVNNTKLNFEDGVYIKDFVIHSLSTLTKEELLNLSFDFVDSLLQDDVAKFKLTHLTVIQADVSMAWSEKALEYGPQIGDGRYYDFYLCGKDSDSDFWKIYEIYSCF